MTSPEAESVSDEGIARVARKITGHLGRLYAHASQKRRRQLQGLVVLMLLGALAELVTLGAVVPFLGLLANPARAVDYPFLQDLFTALGWEDPAEILLPATALFVAIAMAAAATRFILQWATNRFVYGLGYDLAVEVYRRMLYQPYSFHVAHNTSQIIAGVNKVQLVVSGVLWPLLQSGVSAVIGTAIIAMLFYIDPVMAAVAAFCFGTTYGLATWLSRRRLKQNSALIAKAQSDRVQTVQEGLGGIRDVLLDGSQGVHIDRFERVDSTLREAQVANNIISASPRYLIEAIGVTIIAILAYVLTLREGGLAAALPVLGALALGAQRLLPLLQTIYVGWSRVVGNHRMTLDVVELLEQPIPVEALLPSAPEEIDFRQGIELRDVGFRYQPSGPWVIRDADLWIPRGARLGFVGKTGSGKSTLIDLIMGLLEPVSGAILIDDVVLHAENRRNWQARVAHVPQSIFLSDASVAQNIAFGEAPGAIDLEQVREAAEQAQIADFIESELAGYDTVVGERGVRLSGGQRQRIGLARALYRKADLLVLDEATSALDSSTEDAVMDAIDNLGESITVLIIAHRLRTLKGCDTVVRLEAGRITDTVSPEALLNDPDLAADPTDLPPRDDEKTPKAEEIVK